MNLTFEHDTKKERFGFFSLKIAYYYFNMPTITNKPKLKVNKSQFKK